MNQMYKLTNPDLSFEEVELGNRVIYDFVGLYDHTVLQYYPDILFYHSSMDWLLPVLDKIERLGYDTIIIRRKENDIVSYYCKIKQEGATDYESNMVSEYKITAVWSAVIQFCRDTKHKELLIKSSDNA